MSAHASLDSTIDTAAAAGRAASRGLATDSRRVQPGDVFVAIPGGHVDARTLIPQAIAAGAAAVIWEANGFSWDPAWRVPNLPVHNLREQLGVIAAHVYGEPSRQLWLAGVTGTNGKTSCSHWIAQIAHPTRPPHSRDRHVGQWISRKPCRSPRIPRRMRVSLQAAACGSGRARRIACRDGSLLPRPRPGPGEWRGLRRPRCSPISRAIISTITAPWSTTARPRRGCSTGPGCSMP